MKQYNRLIDVIIPAYNVPDAILFRCLSSIACQELASELEVTIVDDASTEQNYAEVIKAFTGILKINLLRYETNGGPGVARQYGLEHTSNGYVTFIDADDTFNGSLALKALRNGIEMNNGLYQMCVGVFDEVHEAGVPDGQTLLMPHEGDMIWMFGKLYRRSFIDKYKELSLVLGKQITYTENEETKEATAVDIDNNGGLVIRTESGTKTLSTGEITVRLK